MGTATFKVYLTRARINSQGYDDTGSYWGVGAPLYCASCDDWDYSQYIRAYDREDAKDQIRARFPGASFFR